MCLNVSIRFCHLRCDIGEGATESPIHILAPKSSFNVHYLLGL